jgi:penicillin amidase
LSILAAVALDGRSLLAPPPKRDVEARLDAIPTSRLPLDGETVIHWNDHQVPFIFAESDTDAAFALGLVHAHLRLGQLEMMRHISQGRLSEMAGPFTAEIDHSLRIFDLGRAAAEMEANFPPDIRDFMARFTAGINHYQESLTALPHEYHVMGLTPKPWSVNDLIAMGRMMASDVSWLIWFRLWNLRTRPDWQQLWNTLLHYGGNAMTLAESSEGDEALTLMSDLLGGLSRNGSNSVAVGPGRTAGGHAMIASDPHLGFLQPNVWLLAGLQSPSYHMVGMMLPGLPFVAVGRNRDIAWGGTNLRAASSDLFDVSGLPASEISEREEKITVRWWFDRKVKVRSSPHGPVISDSPLLHSKRKEAIALAWTGHRASDEVTAMLAANRAANWDEFVAAMADYSVSAQNFVYADTKGNIGRLMAVHLPRREGEFPPMVHTPEQGGAAWQSFVDVRDLPKIYNPAAGYVVSANNRPPPSEVPVGYFFSPEGRAARLAELLEAKTDITFADLHALQTDVVEPAAETINRALVEAAARLEVASDLPRKARAVLDSMTEWDGAYQAASPLPVAFEATFFHFLNRFYGPRLGEEGLRAFILAADLGRTVPHDIAAEKDEVLARALAGALIDAVPVVKKFATWGDMHRIHLRHPLGMVPLIGRRYIFDDYPADGSRQTVMKSNHAPTDKKHYAGYGSQARHITDLADLDENYFVLLGGQDGWLGSTTFLDQAALWHDGKYIRVPLRRETVEKEFKRKMVLKPH